MISFAFIHEKGKNFTPGWKISAYCKENHIECYERYFTQYVKYNGREYTYDHYTIYDLPEDPEHEEVEIFLKLV